MNERPIPPAATADPDSVELLRAWVAQRGLHCSLKVGMYDGSQSEAHAWGIILADVARHVANALHDLDGSDISRTIESVAMNMMKELNQPTSTAEGSFVECVCSRFRVYRYNCGTTALLMLAAAHETFPS